MRKKAINKAKKRPWVLRQGLWVGYLFKGYRWFEARFLFFALPAPLRREGSPLREGNMPILPMFIAIPVLPPGIPLRRPVAVSIKADRVSGGTKESRAALRNGYFSSSASHEAKNAFGLPFRLILLRPLVNALPPADK